MTMTLQEHKHYKYLQESLVEYINETYAGKVIPDALVRYNSYLWDRYSHNVPNILEYRESAVLNPEDVTYPADEFLISLAESKIVMNHSAYLKIMELVCCAWYCFGGIDYVDSDFISYFGENGYSLYTGGWSGNEDIIRALQMNQYIEPFFNIEQDKKCPAVWNISYRDLCKETLKC